MPKTNWEARVMPVLKKKSFVLSFCDIIFVFIPAFSIYSPSVLHWISNFSLIRSTSCSCSTCCFGLGFQLQNLQELTKKSRALIKDIFLRVAPFSRYHYLQFWLKV